MKEGNCVIAVAGASGSGKTELVKELAKDLNGAMLFFDDYSHLMEDTREKNNTGKIDPSKLRITRMVEDIKELLAGKMIKEPRSSRDIEPRKYIIVEDPYGRERTDIAPYYDYVILLDTPLDICLARVLLRINFWKTNNQEPIIDAKEKLVLFEKHLNGTYWTRDYYIAINEYVRKNADIIIDGMQSIETIAKEVITKIKK
ncbi:MAG: hypothetical protein ACFFDW_07585 [Candidatus Thorarchaeota archaeon]